jgi:hypothetical protein
LDFLPPQEKLSKSANQVTANIVVTASEVTYEIPLIPVYVQTPATLTGYDVVLSPTDYSIAHVQVKGPQQGIDAIKDGSFAVKAVLAVELADAGKAVSRVPVYVLPDGVSVTGDSATKAVSFTLNSR